MGRSLGLAAYKAITRRSSERGFTPSGSKPQGTLLWIHVAEAESLLAILDLAQRLSIARVGLQIVITVPDQQAFEQSQQNWVPHRSIQLERLPSEHPDAIDAFWTHWAPDMAIWSWGDLRPNLLHHAHKRACPVVLIDADEAGFDALRDRWLPDLTKKMLEPFVALLARSSAAARRLRSLGINKGRIEITSPLHAGGQILPYQETDLAELSQLLSGRPVWLACNVQKEEIEAVIEAHRKAGRLSHRLVLMLHPANQGLNLEFADYVANEGLRVCDWSSGDEPDDTTQVILATDSEDLGLFYRAAPVAFMGGSLTPGYKGRNPFEAAALGSAVLYGPNVRRFMPFYSRLAKAGAARIVKDGDTLGTAVAHLIAPDQAAAMAHAGWDVVSQGAELTDRVIDLVNTALDGEVEAKNAPA